MAAVEYPGVIARILLIRKFGATALPFQSYFVFGHVAYVGCTRARRHRAARIWRRPALRVPNGRSADAHSTSRGICAPQRQLLDASMHSLNGIVAFRRVADHGVSDAASRAVWRCPPRPDHLPACGLGWSSHTSGIARRMENYRLQAPQRDRGSFRAGILPCGPARE